MQLDYPLHFDHRGRTAATDIHEHVRDLIEQLLLTSPGERVNRPEFGSGLAQMVFGPNSPELAAALQFSVQSGLQQWLGDVIEVLHLEVSGIEATLRVEIRYRIRATGEVRDAIILQETQ